MTQEKTKVLVSCNSMHGVPEALGLAYAGYDVTFATSICFQDLSWVPQQYLFQTLNQRLSSRLYPDLKSVRLRRIWWPEIVHRVLCQFDWRTPSWRFKVQNEIFDSEAARWVDDHDALQFVNGLGLFSARRAKEQGKLVVLSQRAAYPAHARSVLEPEWASFGVTYQHPEHAFLDRVYEEQELADYILVGSSYCAKTFLEAGVQLKKLRIVNLFYNSIRFQPSELGLGDDFRVLFVGAIEPGKGVHYLIEAFNKANLPHAELWLVGSVHSTMTEILEKNKEYIHHVPHVPQQELAEIYRSASVFVLPSLTDGWGFVVLEAMASGVPVIVTENTGAKDAVREGIDGYVVPIRDVDALAEKLVYLYENPSLRCEMGQSAAVRADDFAWPAYFQRLAQTYADILYPISD